MNETENQTQSKVVKKHATAVVLHLFYTELFEEIRANLDFLGNEFDLYVSVPKKRASFVETIKNYYPDAHVLKVENRGRDLAPFLEFLKVILPLDYEILLKIHTKETIHRSDGISWRKDVFNKLLGSETQVEIIKSSFSKNPTLAMIGPKDHVLDSRYYMGSNRDKVQSLLYKAGYPQSLPESFSFVASTMFWAKPEIFKPILDMKIETSSFESEPLPVDGCLPHALERFLGLLVEIQGFEIQSIDQDGIVSAPDLHKIYPFATPPAHLRLRELKSVVFYSAYEEAYAIEHLRITAPFKAAGIEIIEGVRNGIADPDLAGCGDAVIFQREFPKDVLLYEKVVSTARSAGKFIFYEIDDLLFELPENHPERNQQLYNAALLPMITAMIEADLVFVPTEELRLIAEGFNHNVIVLPNYLDDTIWHLKTPKYSSDDQILKIGYMGSNSHTPDLALIAPVLKEIVQKYSRKVQVDIWGTPLPEELVEVEGVNWYPSPTNVYKDFVKFFQTLEFDIAIAPLVDNLFNRCKSGLKFLEYSANGAPGVYSRIAPYEAIIKDGENGFLAGNSDEWLKSLSKLIEDATLRKEMVKLAQKEVDDNWLLSKNIRSWEDIFCKLPKALFFEDLGKSTRVHIYNVVNQQLFLDRSNLKTISQKREEEFSTRFKELETAHQEDIKKTVGDYEMQIEQKQKEFESYSQKREEEFSTRFKELETAHQEDIKKTVGDYEMQIEQKQKEFESYSQKREEEFSTRFKELETAHQEDIKKTVGDYEMQIEHNNERLRKMLVDNDSLNDQLYYWSGQAQQKTIEINDLRNQFNSYEQTLNEIYQSKSWKALTSYQTSKEKIAKASKKILNITTPIERIIPGRFAKKKQAVIDSGLFDPDYYLSKNPDVKDAGVDPLEHYLNFGGLEGRDPSSDFDSSWYLSNNSDVKAAGINPLLHFILFGKEEGRAPKPAAVKEEVPVVLLPGAPISESVKKAVPDVIILTPKIKEILQKNLRENYVLSLSHDDYLTITGGSQVYISDEQRLVNQKDQSYLHIYPKNKVKALVPSDTILYLGVNLDGRQLLETESNELISALLEMKDKKLSKLSIHHSMGFNRSTLQKCLDLVGGKGVFWLHDYFSLCPSYNLRRNDRDYCGAPDLNSNSCRLCKYGDQRKKQAKEFERLFRENQLEVAAPSQFTYELWQSRFPITSTAHIIPPAVLRWGPNNPGKFKGGQLRVAFLGYPLDYKGWPTWLRLVREFNSKDDYRFFHFSSQQAEPGNYKRIDMCVTKENRLAMVEGLRWNEIDVAILWSTVAETFSFTLHEALAAGCFIVTNPNSGNIQNYIRHNPNRGIILKDEKELLDFFQNDGIVNKVINYQKQGKPQAELIFGSLEELNS